MLYRHYRKGCYVALPVFLLLYVATVYGRFHYVTDAITGILTAALVIRYVPSLVALVEAVREPNSGPFPAWNKNQSTVFGLFSSDSEIPDHDTILTIERPVSDSSPS